MKETALACTVTNATGHCPWIFFLEFLKVKWSDNVTEFYKTAEKRGIINTPSYNQVSQPIYTNSMYRWKNYEKEFAKSNISLENWVKEFNY